jgi:hypothetical protein
MEEELKVLTELQKIYNKVSEIRGRLGIFPELAEQTSDTVIKTIFSVIDSINNKLNTINDEVSKLS